MRNLLPNVAPVPIMLMGGTIYLLLCCVSVLFTIQGPWLGISLVELEHGSAVITKVSKQGPSIGVLSVGDKVQGLRCGDSDIYFNKYSFIADPEETPTYENYHEFFEHQNELFSCLDSESIQVILSDGISKTLQPKASRPLISLPVGFWITHLLGFGALIFSLGVWAHRRREISSVLLVLWSATAAILVTSMTVYGFRELAIDSQLFKLLHHINRSSLSILIFTILTLICYYPMRLGKFPFSSTFIALGLLNALNEFFQIIEWPWHAFYFVQVLVYFCSFSALFLQWRLSRQSAIHRAAVIWFVLSVALANGAAIMLYVLPTVFRAQPLTELWVGQACILVMFFGFALGVIRYRLFEVERWWLMTWVWFSAAALVLILDGLLVVFLNIQPTGAFSISVLLVVWAYLPARQWLWHKLFKRQRHQLENYLPAIISAHFDAKNATEFNEQWPAILKTIFRCSDLSLNKTGHFSAPTVSNHGCDLNVPMLDNDKYIILSGKEHGSRLFTSDDEKFANSIFKVVKYTVNLRAEKEGVLAKERSRIMRDLHDDIGAKLLELIHLSETKSTRDIAAQTLKSLRELVYLFTGNQSIRLVEVLAKWKLEVTQRVNASGAKVIWNQPELDNITITARQCVNLGSVVREAITNGLKHSDSEIVGVSINCDFEDLIIIISNHNSLETNPDDWSIGVGRANMETRIREIDGVIVWQKSPDDNRIEVVIKMPLRSLN